MLFVTALVLVVVALAVGTRPARHQQGSVVADSGCADILLLLVPGNAEGTHQTPTGPGPVESRFATAYVANAKRDGRTVTQQVLDFRSAPLSTLRPGRGGPANKVIGRTKMLAWRTGSSGAVTAAIDALRTAATTCPDQEVVLGGYAQGAIVAHRVLRDIAADPAVQRRIIAAVLVSDGERTRNTRATLLGAPAAPHGRRGISAALSAMRHDAPPPDSVAGVWTVCRTGDVVCDFSGTPAGQALRLAHTYATDTKNEAAVREAARRAYVRTSRVPKVVAGQQFTGSVEQLLRGQVRAQVFEADRPGLRFATGSTLPPGLTLNARGLLSGVPTTAGSWTVDYTVRNTTAAAYARPRAGSFTVTISKNHTSTLSAGGQSSCAIRADHTLWCWGVNDWGQIGDSTLTDRRTPVRVGQATNWASVSASGSHTCGVRTDGSLYCWGMNSYGQLGDGSRTKRLKPTRITQSTAWTSVSTSFFGTCALSKKGALYCWGQGRYGEIGDGGTDARTSPTRVGTEYGWASVALGGSHTCALRTDGTAWCWGANDVGQLGLGTLTPHRTPTRVGTATDWTKLSANWSNTCGIASSGAVRCWGLNNDGQIGDSTRAMRTSPTTVRGGGVATDLSVGDSHVCERRADGTLWCWGANVFGQLGNGNRATRWVPVQASGSGWVNVESGWEHGCGVVTDGSIRCWGVDDRGQLGDGGNVSRTTPTTVLRG